MRSKKILNFSIIAISFTVLTLALFTFTIPVQADEEEEEDCTSTVTAPASIQSAVDAASEGDVVCLDDSGGDFVQQVVFDSTDSGITLTAADGSSPVLDGATLAGSGPTTISAIELLSGVSDVTIRGLEIKNFEGDGGGNDRSSGIVAASGTTSDITIKNNVLDDNKWNGVLVFSEGDFVHDDWEVKDNTVENNGFVGIELTNCNKCEITDNDVHGHGFADIIVQIRNTIPASGLLTIKDVEVKGNTVGDSGRGIEILSFTGDLSFNPISGASTLGEEISIKDNTVTDSTVAQIRFDAFNDAASNLEGKIEGNTINCAPVDLPTFEGAIGIDILERGASGQTGEVSVKLKDNTIDTDCIPPIHYHGDSEKVTIKD